MTVLDVVKGAATVLGLDVPSAVFGATSREMVEMQELCNEMAQEIADACDWRKLLVIRSFVGDGTSEAFSLPDDYDRMLKTASLWSSRWFWSINQVTDPDQWIELQVVPISSTYGNWIIYGDEIHILPVMESTETVKFFYVSSDIVAAADTTTKEAFTDDTDAFRLPERLLKLAIIYRWKQHKGLPYAEALEDFQRELGTEMERQAGGKPIITAQPYASWRGKNIAWPGSASGAP